MKIGECLLRHSLIHIHNFSYTRRVLFSLIVPIESTVECCRLSVVSQSVSQSCIGELHLNLKLVACTPIFPLTSFFTGSCTIDCCCTSFCRFSILCTIFPKMKIMQNMHFVLVCFFFLSGSPFFFCFLLLRMIVMFAESTK